MARTNDNSGTSIRALRGFLPYLSEQAGRLVGAYAATTLGVVLMLLLPWPLKFIIDNLLAGEGGLTRLAFLTEPQQLIVLAAGMGMVAALAAIVLAAEKVMHARVRERFSYQLRDDLVQQVYRLNRETRQSEMSGELTMRLVSDTQLVSRLFCKTLPIAAKHVLTAVATLAAIVAISLPIGIAALLMAGLLASMIVYYGPRLAAAAAAKREHEGQVSAHTQETINGIEHIQAMALEQQSRDRYLRAAGASLRAGVDEVRMAVRLERSSQILAGLSLALVAGIGGIAVLQGHLLLGELTVCLSYIATLLKPIEKINEIAKTISRGIVRAHRVRRLFDAPLTPENLSGTVLPDSVQCIECRDVDYRYRGSNDAVINGLTHTFQRGECTAIVGPSGCGKSTLLRMILGLESPTGGELLANGLNYDTLLRRNLRSDFAVLLQDAHLFAGTLRSILTEASAAATDIEIQAVLDDVDLSQLIDSLPLGLDTPIDEAGARFSVGQRARLLLARALLSQRPVLLLDEPFANLDDDSRQVILACLAEAKKSRILIIVTHEQALLGLADHVLSVRDFQAEKGLRAAPDAAQTTLKESGHAVAQ